MNRTHLERAAEAIVSGLGYAFAAVPDGRAPLAVAAYPAALLAPLELRSVEGRKHGLATYGATLRLMRDGARTNPAGRREAAAALENLPFARHWRLSAQTLVSVALNTCV